MNTEVVKVTGDSAFLEAAQRGAAAIKAGKLVGFATETVYGIAAMTVDRGAMDRLRELKSRPDRPFSVHVSRPSDAGLYVRDLSALAGRLIRKAWPGPLTLLIKVGGSLAEERFQKAGLYETLCQEDIIGLRCPQCAVAQAMLAAVDWPVVAPSANPAGAPSPRSAEEVLANLDGKIDLLIDSGPTRLGADSTVVRLDGPSWGLLREGVLGHRAVERMARNVILFVCTGNTCRSPIAAGLARRMLAEKKGCKTGQLPQHGIEIMSAGLWAFDGSPVSPEAVATAGELGADIAGHRSQKLTTELINGSDMIFCMTDAHVDEVRRMSPAAAGRVCRLSAIEEIQDPFGGGEEAYRSTVLKIEQALKKIIEEEKYEDSVGG